MESSPKITRLTGEELRQHQPSRVIELGAGVGTVTGEILDSLPSDGQLLCIEKETPLFERLQQRINDPRAQLLQGEGQNLRELIKGTPFEKPDAVVSTVPLTIPGSDELCRVISEEVRPDTLYVQLTINNTPMKPYFDILRTYRIRWNLPPEKLHVAQLKTKD